MKRRNPYEQQEFQRKNPHLFTTPTQVVNVDGNITTFQEVTRNIQAQLDRLEEIYNGHAFYEQPQLHFYLTEQLYKVRQGFVANYKWAHQRLERVTTATSPDNKPSETSQNALSSPPNDKGEI